MVNIGFWLWMMSDFQKLPTQEEVSAYDDRWISDMRLAHRLYSHQNNHNPVMRMFEEHNAFTQDPKAYADKKAFEKQAEQQRLQEEYLKDSRKH